MPNNLRLSGQRARDKENGMIYIGRKCEVDGCKDRPYYGVIGGSVLRCRDHAIKDMVNLKHKICQANSCTKRAYYGFKDGVTAKGCNLERTLFVLGKDILWRA